MASAQRHRPKAWVQAYRKVPVSSSRASTGAPANAPIRAGTACRKILTIIAVMPYRPVKFMAQASVLAGWHAVA